MEENNQPSGTSPQLFREGMKLLAGTVTIVTTNGAHGKGGFTATAVCSVTDTPPTLLVCINNLNELLPTLLQNQCFAVNILPPDFQDLANRFAGFDAVTMPERLDKGNWSVLKTGAPVLNDSVVTFDCSLKESVKSGTHTVVFGNIEDIKINNEVTPLIYFNRDYTTLKQ